MRTVHYGTIPDLGSIDAGGDGSGPSRRLFLKPETWGVRRNPIWSSTVADSLSEGMRERKTRFSDWYESTRHMLRKTAARRRRGCLSQAIRTRAAE
jgi:hypothetical protein